MLFILGGVSRSGKSIIARRLVREKQRPFFCIDFLITSLEKVPSLKIKQGQAFIPKAEKIWPIIKPMLSCLIKEEPNYLVEGDGILPKQVSGLLGQFPNEIKVCFVGFSEIDPRDKLKQVREFGGNMDDWTKSISDEQLIKYLEDMIAFSRYLKEECKKYSLSYFDSSKNFPEYLEKVFQYLL